MFNFAVDIGEKFKLLVLQNFLSSEHEWTWKGRNVEVGLCV